LTVADAGATVSFYEKLACGVPMILPALSIDVTAPRLRAGWWRWRWSSALASSGERELEGYGNGRLE
jgi:hypothetical protein